MALNLRLFWDTSRLPGGDRELTGKSLKRNCLPLNCSRGRFSPPELYTVFQYMHISLKIVLFAGVQVTLKSCLLTDGAQFKSYAVLHFFHVSVFVFHHKKI